MEKTFDFSKGLVTNITKEKGEKLVISAGVGRYDIRGDIAEEMGFAKAVYEGQCGNQSNGFSLRKALSTTLATYSAGTLPVLIPVYVDPEIIDETRKATPLVELIPRVTNYGKTADFNVITSIGGAQPLGEDAALTEQNDTYTRRSVGIKYLYSVGRVTGPMFAASKQYLASGGYVDALSLEVKNKTLALKRLEEAMILLGDTAADWTDPSTSTSYASAYSYNGLYQLISNANSNGLGGSSSYVTDLAGAAISISAIRTAIRTARTAGGEPNLIVTDYATYDAIKALIQDQLRYVSTTTIAWGITTMSFEGIPIIASRFLSTTAGNGSKVPQDGKSLFVLDTNVIEMRVLQDVSYEELAKTNDSIKFMLKVYEALVCKAPKFNHVIYDIL
jgi:hypothetical protein